MVGETEGFLVRPRSFYTSILLRAHVTKETSPATSENLALSMPTVISGGCVWAVVAFWFAFEFWFVLCICLFFVCVCVNICVCMHVYVLGVCVCMADSLSVSLYTDICIYNCIFIYMSLYLLIYVYT